MILLKKKRAQSCCMGKNLVRTLGRTTGGFPLCFQIASAINSLIARLRLPTFQIAYAIL